MVRGGKPSAGTSSFGSSSAMTPDFPFGEFFRKAGTGQKGLSTGERRPVRLVGPGENATQQVAKPARKRSRPAEPGGKLTSNTPTAQAIQSGEERRGMNHPQSRQPRRHCGPSGPAAKGTERRRTDLRVEESAFPAGNGESSLAASSSESAGSRNPPSAPLFEQ